MSGMELKATARRIIAENAPKIFLVSIIYLIVTTLMSELQYRLPGTASALDEYLDSIAAGSIPSISLLYTKFRPSGVALAVVLQLMLPVIHAGYMGYCLKLHRGQSGEYKDLLNAFLFFGKVLLLSIVTAVFVLLWSALLIIPGLVAHYRYRQAYFILIDDPDKSVLQCIRESKKLMHGKKLDLFLVDLSFIGWVIISTLVVLLLPLPFSLPVVSIWLSPYQWLTRAAFYDRLIGEIAL